MPFVPRSGQGQAWLSKGLADLLIQDLTQVKSLAIVSREQAQVFARELQLEASFFHTNHEGEFVEELHKTPDYSDALLLNPGAWTHYSYAIRDALELFDAPIVEVHLSNIEQREEWRRKSVVAELAAKRILGKGAEGYREALEFIVNTGGAAQ